MTTTLEPPIPTPLPPTLDRMTHTRREQPAGDQFSVVTPMSQRVGKLGLLGLRLAIGFEFLWAFLDKTFGLGYHNDQREGLDPRRLTDYRASCPASTSDRCKEHSTRSPASPQSTGCSCSGSSASASR